MIGRLQRSATAPRTQVCNAQIQEYSTHKRQPTILGEELVYDGGALAFLTRFTIHEGREQMRTVFQFNTSRYGQA